MEVTKANQWARDIARYVSRHPCAVELRVRVRNLTLGHQLDDNDLDQLTRKVRWLMVGEPALRRMRERSRSDERAHRPPPAGRRSAARHPPAATASDRVTRKPQ